jgi:iron complex outermembrane receptor protein
MSRERVILFALFFIFGTHIHSEETKQEIITFNIVHQPVTSAVLTEPITIRANISDPSKVAYAAVNYRLSGEKAFKVVFMNRVSGDLFETSIPAEDVLTPGIEYFIFVMDVRGVPHMLFRDAKTPQMVNVTEEKAPEQRVATGLEAEFALFAAEEVVYGAAKHEQKISESPSAVTVLTEEDIRAIGAESIPELLRYVPGMDVEIINASFYTLGARGFTTEANNLLLVLIDGMEVNIELFGEPFWLALPITINDIKRIEVIRGPGSALYGANAFAGVVNIITKDPKGSSAFYYDAKAGNYHATSITSGVTSGVKDWGYKINAEFMSADSWEEKKNLIKGVKANTTIQYMPSEDLKSLLNTNFVKGNIKIPSTLGDIYASAHISYFRFNTTWKNLRIQSYWTDLAIEDLNLDIPGIPATPAFEKLIPTVIGKADQIDVDVQYNYTPVDWTRFIFGSNYRTNIVKANVLPDSPFQEARVGLFLQNELYPFRQLILTTGFRYDYNTITKPGYSPRASIVYSPFEEHTFRMSFGRAFRKPAFLEYGLRVKSLEDAFGVSSPENPEGILIANPDLANEEITSFEFGYVAKPISGLKGNIDLYYNLFRNKIQFDPATTRYQNVEADADTFGGELSLEYAFMKGFGLFANYAYFGAKDKAKEKGGLHINPNDAYPNHKLNAGIKWDNFYGFNGFLALHSVCPSFGTLNPCYEREMVDPNSTRILLSPSNTIVKVYPYTILNARLGYRFFKETIEVGIYGFNILHYRIPGEDGYREFPGILWYRDTDGDLIPDKKQTFVGELIGTKVLGYLSGRF